jgi:hypothetical protein
VPHPFKLRRVLFALPIVVALQFALVGTALGATPVRDGFSGIVASGGATGAGGGPTAGPDARDSQARPVKPGTARGYDISYPQCGGAYPSNPAFAIVGVNGGKVFSANPCLASQIAWGGGASAELYINTGNPGPELSSFWPVGQTSPRICDGANPDTVDCAYDYGWNAAQHSYATAEAAYAELEIATSPSVTAWWLDVETTNSWRSDNLELNVAALQGGVAYLQSRGITRIGFYSTTFQWGVITGGTKVFSPAPSWGAGARNERGAKTLCQTTTTSFTGGRLAMVQWVEGGFDVDIRC